MYYLCNENALKCTPANGLLFRYNITSKDECLLCQSRLNTRFATKVLDRLTNIYVIVKGI